MNWETSFCFYFMNNLRSIGINSCFKVIEICAKTVCPSFLFGRLLITASILLGAVSLFKLFIWSWFDCGKCYVLRNVSISFRFSHLVEYRYLFIYLYGYCFFIFLCVLYRQGIYYDAEHVDNLSLLFSMFKFNYVCWVFCF